MITNIVDDRKNNKKWKLIWGTVEPTFHDNSCRESDRAEPDSSRLGFIQFTSSAMPLTDILTWANQFPGENTLYLRNTNPQERMPLEALDSRLTKKDST